jgi:D-beta-D-heptose 7-phosphate kinase/D-beta-D-heptose 1-phosphate adenosyltransferase
MNSERLQYILRSAAGKRFLVIGDVMLDEFVWGKVSRISPEAPVPVVEVVSESCYPGGAANVARNLVEFTPHVRVLGAIGRDAHGVRLVELLGAEGIRTDALIPVDDWPTIVKTRIIARQQQVVRVDRERRTRVGEAVMSGVMERVHDVLPETDVVIFEDYGKGFLGQEMTDQIGAAARERGIVVCVDPNPGNPIDWSGATVIKPNRGEAFAAAGMVLTEAEEKPLSDGPLLEVGRRLVEMWGVEQLLVTLGEHGMILFERGNEAYHTPTRAQEVFDVSGAGDTVIAVYALGLAAGVSAREAAEMANHAAGIVVGKLGTATVGVGELVGSFGS